jgi:uncharacterized protein
MRIVIAGASGFLGTRLVQRLVAAGHHLTVLSRTATPVAGARSVAWQPDGHAGPWASEIDGVDAVVNLAGESIDARRWTAARKRALIDSRLLSTRSVSAAIARAASKPRVLLNASGVGYYGAHGDEEVTEADPPGSDFLAQLCVHWEAAARANEELGVRVVCLRTGLVLDAHGGALPKMLLPFRLGLGGPFGSGSQYWPWIHLADWVRLVEFALTNDNASGPLNLSAPNPVRNDEFARTLARALRRPALLRAPAFALKLVLGEMADAVLTGQRAMPARALAEGFRFEYGELDGALRELLRA